MFAATDIAVEDRFRHEPQAQSRSIASDLPEVGRITVGEVDGEPQFVCVEIQRGSEVRNKEVRRYCAENRLGGLFGCIGHGSVVVKVEEIAIEILHGELAQSPGLGFERVYDVGA